MQMNTRTLVVALLLVGSAASFSSGEEKAKEMNLIVNGSFEDGPDPGEFKMLEKGSTEIKGWEVSRGSVDYIGSYWQQADGKRSIDLNGSGRGGVSQAIKTKKGQKYAVTFNLAGNPEGGAAVKKMKVGAVGNSNEFTFDITGKSRTEMGWASKTWEFTATADETTLEFYSTTDDDDAYGPVLDNVTVKEAK